MNGLHLKRLFSALLTALLISACSSGGSDNKIEDTAPLSSSSSSGTSSTSSSGSTVSIDDQRTLVSDLATQIVTAYANTSNSFSVLKTAADNYCASPTDKNQFVTLQQAWRDAALSWQYIQVISFGPASEDKKRQYISRYPVSPSDLNTALTKLFNASETVTPTYIAAESAPSQGLPALEFFLFSKNAFSTYSDPAKNPRYCEIVSSISSNLITMLDTITLEWQPTGASYLNFINPDNSKDILSSWLFDIAYNLVVIHDSKLGDALNGKSTSIETPMALQSLQNISANIQFIQDAFGAGETQGLKFFLIKSNLLSESQDLETLLKLLLSNLNQDSNSIASLTSTPEGLITLEEKQALVHDLFEYFVIRLANTLEIDLNLSLYGEGD